TSRRNAASPSQTVSRNALTWSGSCSTAARKISSIVWNRAGVIATNYTNCHEFGRLGGMGKSIRVDSWNSCRSGSVLQLCVQPCLGKSPVAPHSHRRNFEHFCHLVIVEPAKIFQLDYLSFSGVECGQSFQCLVQINNFLRFLR